MTDALPQDSDTAVSWYPLPSSTWPTASPTLPFFFHILSGMNKALPEIR
ncbi:hypothetical protein [Endozoicomonas atrinae]|nr:hypothetical protein [Endozoicomonas atrinae]